MVHPKMAQMTSALIAVLMVASAQAQTAPAPIDATYRFTVGGAPVVDATLWLYNEETLWPGSRRAWHRPKRRQHDSPDASMIESIDSHGDANVYWVALHVEGMAWFKTPSFRDPFREIARAMETILDLQPPVKIRFTCSIRAAVRSPASS